MIAATKATQAPRLSLFTDTWLGRLWRAVSKTSERERLPAGEAAQNENYSAPRASLTEGYLQTLNVLHKKTRENPTDHGYSALSDDGDGDDAAEINDPVVAIIQESLSGLAADPAFRFCGHIYTVRYSSDMEPSRLVVTKTPSDAAT